MEFEEIFKLTILFVIFVLFVFLYVLFMKGYIEVTDVAYGLRKIKIAEAYVYNLNSLSIDSSRIPDGIYVEVFDYSTIPSIPSNCRVIPKYVNGVYYFVICLR